jgi:hypothetical protein
VCAFDAQTPSVSPSGTACDTVDAYDDVGCGCGPELRWCTTSSAQDKVLASFEDDLEKRVDAVISNHQSYLELFTGRTGWVNGPIVYYLKYQSKLYGDSRLSPLPLDASRLPDLAFTDETTWKAVELGEEQAGILTAPGFLLRFMTNRARANRFYTYFLCQPFQPPEDGLPAPGESEPILDLQVRDGCKYCHAILEPAASYWGRWTESGAGYLPAEDYPPLDDGCQQCALTGSGCTDDCRRYYVSRALTEEEEPWLGMLRTYEFRDEEHYSNIEVGPRLLASRSVEDDRLPSCVSSTAVRWLLGRDPLEEEQAWIDELSLHFIQSNYDYSSLVREIVTSGVYRRVE